MPSIYKGLLSAGLFVLASHSSLAMNITSVGKNSTYGAVSAEGTMVGTRFNPASATHAAWKIKNGKSVAGEFSGGMGIEYGDVSEIFDLLNGLGSSFTDSEEGAGGEQNDEGDRESILDELNIDNPELEALIDGVAAEAARLAAVLAIVATEGYARANVDSQFSLLFKSSGSGAFAFDYSLALTSGILGVVDEIEFDPATALSSLQNAYNLSNGDPSTTFDLTGGAFITVNPEDGSVDLEFENDSLLFTRSASIQEFAFTYSNKLGNFSSGSLYWGAAPKVVYAGLSNAALRIGDITDAEKVFDELTDAEFINETAFGLNAGILWVGGNYTLGASVDDLVEIDFDFPRVDTSTYENEQMKRAVEKARTYTMKSQLSLEGNYTSSSKKWSLNAALDANPVEDILGFEYQWLNLSAGFHLGGWVLPDVRLGFHQNLAGSELSYFAAGITFLKFFNLDLSASPDSVKINEDTLPRGLSAAIGINYSF